MRADLASGIEAHQNSRVRPLALAGQTVLVIGGSSGIGLETARCARSEGANVILTGRDSERLGRAAGELGASHFAVFDAADPAPLAKFFAALAAPVDHVMVTAGRPSYGRLVDADLGQQQNPLGEHARMLVQIARTGAGSVTAGGTILFTGGVGGRRPGVGHGILATVTASLPALTANLALELAPIRVNLIAAGFVDTPLSASILGAQLEERRRELRAKLPIRRVVQASDVAALAVHIMTNTALTGATYDVDGGQQLLGD